MFLTVVAYATVFISGVFVFVVVVVVFVGGGGSGGVIVIVLEFALLAKYDKDDITRECSFLPFYCTKAVSGNKGCLVNKLRQCS